MGGMFGAGFRTNPNQQFGQGYDPVSGSMSLSEPQVDTSWLNNVQAKPSFGSRLLNGLQGGVQAYRLGQGQPGAVAMYNAQQQSQRDLLEHQRAIEIARIKAAEPPNPTSLMQNFAYLGIDPKSPLGQRVGINSIERPVYLGNPEAGFNPVGGAYGTPSASSIPTVTDQASFDAIPPGSQFRDPQGNVRRKP